MTDVNPKTAYFEAVAGILARERGETGYWSNPCIYWATVAVGAFDLKTKSYPQLQCLWEAALAFEQAHPHTEPIPEPRQRSLERCTSRPPPGAARKVVAELYASIARKKQGAPDHKRWARRIQARIAAGDTSVTELQARAAEQALRQKA